MELMWSNYEVRKSEVFSGNIVVFGNRCESLFLSVQDGDSVIG